MRRGELKLRECTVDMEIIIKSWFGLFPASFDKMRFVVTRWGRNKICAVQG